MSRRDPQRRGPTRVAGSILVAIVLATASVLVTQPLLVSEGFAARLGPDEVSGMTADVLNGWGCVPAPTPSPTPRPTPSPTPRPTPSPTPTTGPTPTPGSGGVMGGGFADRSSLTAYALGADTPIVAGTSDAPAGIPGIDISKWQGKVDLAAARAAGLRFVYTKATQGTDMLDEWYDRHVRAARSAGILLGSYHFFDYRKDGNTQADWFVKAMRDAGADMNVLPPVVDVECLQSLGRADRVYARAQLRELVSRVYARTGRVVMIYTSRTMWDKVTGGDPTFGGHPLWVACWIKSSSSTCADRPILPVGWSSWTFWQHGPARLPDGRKVDGNVFGGSSSALGMLKSRPMVVAGDVESTKGGSLGLQLRGVDGVSLRTSIDASGGWGPWGTREAASSVILDGAAGMRTIRVQGRDSRGTYGFVFSDTIRLDRGEPRVTARRVRLMTGTLRASQPRIPLRVEWVLSGTLGGVATRTVEVRCDGRRVLRLSDAIGGPATTGSGRAALRARSGDRCTVAVRALDAGGAPMASHTSVRSVAAVDDDARALHFSRGWAHRLAHGAYEGGTTSTTRPGSRLRYTFTGDQVALVATKGPRRGRIRVLIDGRTAATVDLRRSSTAMRRIVFARGLAAGTHTIEVLVIKGRGGRAGRVDIDGIVTTRP